MHNVDLYHKSNIMQKTIAINYVKEHMDVIKWKKNSMIMDIGCGDGRVTNAIMEIIPDCKTMIGCDVNKDMIRFAEENYASENIQFMVLDIGGNVPDSLRGKFHHSFSFFALQWVQEQRIAYQNIYDLLKKDGDLLAIFPGRAVFFDVLRLLSKSKRWTPWLKDVEKFIAAYQDSQDPINDLRTIVNSVGFKDVDIKYKVTSYQYETLQHFKEAIMSLMPCKIPDDMVEEFLEELCIEMQRLDIEEYKHTKSAREYVHNFNALVLYARK